MSHIRIEYDAHDAERWIREGQWNDDTLPSIVEHFAIAQPHHPALLGKDGARTYAELWDAARKLAAGFVKQGLGKGDVIAAQLPNIEEFVIAYVAANLIGAIYQPIHLPYRTPELKFLLGHGGAKAFIGLSRRDEFRPATEVRALRSVLPKLRHVITVDAREDGCIFYADLANVDERCEEMPAPDNPALLLYTSGTTSNPKGVPHSHRSLMSAARFDAAEFGMSADDIALTVSRFSHMWGICALLMSLRVGATILLLPNFTKDEFVQIVGEKRPTFVFAAPVHLIQTFRDGTPNRHDFSSIRVVSTSGANFPPDQLRYIRNMLPNGEILELWGMTEIAPGAFVRPGTPPEVSAGTVGPPVPGCDMRIVSPDGRLLGDGEEGELEVRGIAIFTGYLENPEANASSFTADGWFRTGDLAIRNSNGHYRITGRIKEIINRGGVKFSPLEVEKTLVTHPRISACAVVPVPDPVYGERACCCIVVSGNEAMTLQDICNYLQQNEIGKGMWPERLEILETLPMTPTGKVCKGVLIDMFKDQPAP